MSNISLRIREANQEDVNFIFASWLRSYRASKWAKQITNTVYFAEHHKVLERLLKNNKVFVACHNDDPGQLYGFICADKIDNIFCLHYIYVKQTFRNLGIGTMLLNAFEHDPNFAAVYTHHAPMADRLAPKYNMVHHPYLAFTPKEGKNEKK